MSQSKPAKYKIVVSDFHVGKGRYLSDGTQNIFEDFLYDREFAEFLEYHQSGQFADAEVELILNGDIINLLNIDYYGVHTHFVTERSQVWALKKVIKGHPEFFEALRKFVRVPGHTVSYVIGNHDAGMMFPGCQKLFSKEVGAEVKFFSAEYEFDGVYVEHGQQHERMARLDLKKPFLTRGLPEPILNLPWGSLFVSVYLPTVKQDRPAVDKVRPFSNFLTWSLVHDFRWGVGAALATIYFFIETFLVKSRYQVFGAASATVDLIREIQIYPDYDKVAFKILDDRPDVHCVIFGHTHVLKYRRWKEGKEYFNEGTWNEVTSLTLGDYGTRTRLTYAFIEYPRDLDPGNARASGRPVVRLKEWKGAWRPESELVI